MRCPGSVKASEGIPNVSSPAAEEGTMLHEVAANLLMGLPHEYEITDEQEEVVRAYVDLVKQEAEGKTLYVETKFKLPQHPEFWGTADCVVVDGDNLRIYDFKAGRGVAVEVDYNGRINPQLGFYALGACSALGKYDWGNVELIVVQPRFGGVKRRTTNPQELEELVEEMIAATKLAELDDAPRHAGSHCKFCLARATCPQLRDYVYELARMDFDAVA
jgi:predicted RecB family nuclease